MNTINHHRAMSEELAAAYERITDLETALKHAQEALFWHDGENFEIDGRTVGQTVAEVLS